MKNTKKNKSSIKKMLVLCIATPLFLISCFSNRIFIDVPQSKNKLSIDYPFNLFTCFDCTQNYDLYFERYFIHNKISWQPFSEKELCNKEFFLKTHNTLLTIGYSNILSRDFFNYNIKGFIDSVIYWENRELDTLSYYSKFLDRRNSNGTREITISILKDIAKSFNAEDISINSKHSNDTIVKLINYDLKLRNSSIESLDKKLSMEIFEYLKSLNEYSMAYKFMYRPIDFSTYNISKDSLLKTMPLDTVKEYAFTDSTERLGFYDKNSKWNDSFLMRLDYPGP